LLEGVIRFIEHIESRAPLSSLGVIDLAQIEKLALYHTSTGANAFDDAPVTMLFASLRSLVTLQLHEAIFSQKNRSSTGKVCPTARFEKRTPENTGKNDIFTSKKGVFCRE